MLDQCHGVGREPIERFIEGLDLTVVGFVPNKMYNFSV